MRRAAWPLAAAALLLLPALGLFPLFDVDEGAFSEATREMLQGGDWLSTTLNGAPRFDKPILIYWLQALSVGAFGLGEFALRLPSALAAIAWAWAIAAFVAPRWGDVAARWSAWIAASCLGVLAMGRAATADALLNALLAALMLDLWRHLESGSRPALRRTYLWMALGVLTKGPIAVLIPLAVSLAYCATARRWRDWLRAVSDPWGWGILLLVAAPWYAAQLALHGRAFIDGFLLRHNVERFQGTLEGHGGSIFYYVAVAPLLLLPWTGLLWRAAAGARAGWQEPATRYLQLWFLFVLVFFSLSGTKLPHYVLYGMTPLFILCARAFLQGRGAAVVLVPACLLALALPFAPLLVDRVSHAGAGEPSYYFAQAQRALEVAGTAYYAITVLAALGACAAGAWVRGPAARRAAIATGCLAASVCYAFVPWLGEVLSGPVRDAAAAAQRAPGAVVQWNLSVPSFSVYRRAVTPSRAPQPGEWAITRTDRLAPQDDLVVEFREGGVALVRIQQR